MTHGPAVVAGFDGSAAAARAVRFAAEDAALRKCPLTIVHVRERGSENSRPLQMEAATGIARGYLDAEQIVAVETPGEAGAELIAASRAADLLVVGRGDVFRLGSALGSTALEVVTHAECPVVTVGMTDPAASDPDAVRTGVLAGLRQLDHAEAILAVAFEEAELRGCGVEVVHAWRHPVPDRHGEMMFPVYDPVLYTAEQGERLAHVVQKFTDKYPEVPVTLAAPHAGAVDARLVAADFAALVVLGKPHRGPIRQLLLGSAGQTLLRQLDCPVVFVREDRTS
jgi:nucleotide-binding universal stress UspA family protein